MENADFKARALDIMPKSLFIFDDDLNVVYCNHSFEVAFGVKCGKFSTVGEGISCENFVLNQSCEQSPDCLSCHLSEALRRCIAQKSEMLSRNFSKTIVTRVGSRRMDMVLNVRPIDERHYLCLIDDITESEDKKSRERRKEIKLFRDLDKAKEIQSSFLPVKKGLERLCDFTYYYRQQFKVGGDFFNVYKINDHTFGAYIADVSGAGMSGGMLTVFLRENFDTSQSSPAAALSALSGHFNRLNLSEESYITVFAVVVDIRSRTIAYCNAGHNQPMLLRRGANVLPFIMDGRPVCSWYEDLSYKDSYTEFSRGDVLAFYTDGITEMRDEQGAFYGENRVMDELMRGKDIYATLRSITDSLTDFNGGKSLDEDDLTVLLIDLKH